MLLVTHILIALTSIVWTSLAVVLPSKLRITVSYGFVAATLVSGTALVVSTGAHILQACITGLIYTAIVTTGIVIARNRFAHQED